MGNIGRSVPELLKKRNLAIWTKHSRTLRFKDGPNSKDRRRRKPLRISSSRKGTERSKTAQTFEASSQASCEV